MDEQKKDKTTDLRAAERRSTKVAVVCRPYASSGAVRAAEGVMRNFSSEGSYVETLHRFKSGSILVVRTIGSPPMPSSTTGDETPRSISLAQVKWRQELNDDLGIRYGMGLKFID